MESAEKHDTQLIQGVEGATQPEAQKPIPLTSELKHFGVDVTHITGSTFDELMGGEGGGSRDRTAPGKMSIGISRIRESLKNKFLRKKAA